VGIANDGYLYVEGANLNIGAVSGGSNIIFFTNGSDSYANEKMRIASDGLITCQGNVLVPNGTESNHAVNLGQLNGKQDSLGGINGIVKGDGVGGYSAATPTTDYIVSGDNISELNNNSGYLTTLALDGLSDVDIQYPQVDDILKYNGAGWYNGTLSVPTSGGSGIVLYPTDVPSDIGSYMSLNKFPAQGEEEIEEAICNNNKVLIDAYITEPLGINKIDSGSWSFDIWGYCSTMNHSVIVVDVYAYSTSGETLLFSESTKTLTDVLEIYNIITVRPEYSTNTTDRVLIKISGQTDRTSDTTIYFVNQGTEHYSSFKTPLLVRHNDLAEIQGGTQSERYHLTQAQVTSLSTFLTDSSNLNASNLTSGTVNNARLSSSVTLQGNTFNGVSQLIQTNASGYFPGLNGSLITNLTKSQVGLSNVPDTNCTDASNISSGTLSDNRLSSLITKQGNTFNGNSQLIQTNASGYFPGLNGSLITNISTTNLVNTNTAFNQNFETSTANIKMNGAVNVGSLSTIARADHIHASDTSREAVANKSTTTALGTSDTLYPTQNAVKTYVDNAITGVNNTRTGLHTSISVKNTGTQSIGANTDVLVQLPTEDYDINTEFASNTFTSKTIQTVLVSSYIEFATDTLTSDRTVRIKIFKNGSEVFRNSNLTRKTSNSTPSVFISFPVKVAIGDTLNIYAWHNDSNARSLNGQQVLTIEQLY
jgi:hypothetical protein